MNNPFLKYKNTAVATADPSHQLVFIFDEITKLLYVSKKAIEKKDFEKKYKAITKITDVLYTLQSALVLEDSESSKNSSDFYKLAISKLEKICMSDKDSSEMEIIIDAFKTIRSSIAAEIKK